ncbi:MAG: hypothetical protein AAF483_14555 [Planctomycetota bacterium]
MTGSRESNASRAILACWMVASFFAAFSIALWIFEIPQLATRFSVVPAVTLVLSLFSLVSSLYLLKLHDWVTRLILPTSLLTAVWALAVAIGI